MTNAALAPLKSTYRFLKHEVLYGTLLYRYGITRQRTLLKNVNRSQTHTYTCFYRSPGQLDALTGPVMEFLLKSRVNAKLQINLFAGSNGAEAYTLASVLRQAFPKLDFHITASDLHQSMVDHASAGVYSSEDVHRGVTTEQFIAETFEKIGDAYRVRPEIRERVSFRQASLLDPDLRTQFEPADLVFAQNVFFHLNQDMARTAFRNVAQFLKPHSALFIDGMELDMREELTSEAGLRPLDYRCREIHELARKHIGDRWWNYYYGMEPYVAWHPNRVRRFSTIFLKDA